MKNFGYLIFFILLFGCQKEKSTIIKPKADFEYKINGNSEPYQVQFADKSINAVSYYWIFDNLDTSTLKNPSYTFRNAGIYQISLIVKSTTNSVDTISKTIQLGDNLDVDPTADFEINFIGNMAPCLIRLKNTSLNGNTYKWDFGDGDTSTSNLLLVDHVFQKGGSFLVKLEVLKNIFRNGQLKTVSSKIEKWVSIEYEPSYFVVDTFCFINSTFFPNFKISSNGAYPVIGVWNNPASNSFWSYQWGEEQINSSDKPKLNLFPNPGKPGPSTKDFLKTVDLYMELRLMDAANNNLVDWISDNILISKVWPTVGSGLSYPSQIKLSNNNFILKIHWEY